MKISTAEDITRLACLVNKTPQCFRRFVVCAPFVSWEVLVGHIMPGGKARVSIDIITNEETAENLKEKLGHKAGKIRITARKDLHAKVYVACGVDARDSVALIGSFNLTHGALHKNLELGIKLTGNKEEERRLISELERGFTGLVN